MSMTKLPSKNYNDGRTKQSFKDETDVNNIIRQHARMDTLSHLEQWSGQYGDLSDFDFQTAHNQIAHANTMFEQLPPQVKNQFSNSPEQFFDYVNDPENKDDLAKKLPALAEARSRALPTPAETVDPEPQPDPDTTGEG